MLLSLLLAEEITEVSLGTQHKFIYLFTESDFVIQLTLLIMLAFSVISWAIIGMKYKQIKREKKLSEKFLSQFSRSKTLDSLIQSGPFLKSPVFSIFKSAITALKEKEGKPDKEKIYSVIKRTTNDSIENLESYTPFLATTASAAPFIGLFGTVWGILNAFWNLGQAGGSTTLEVVGPSIGEALTATALGLFAAIPAVIAFNYFYSKIRLFSRDLNQFADDLAARIEDEYIK